MKLDNKGFAISGILYAVMILFLTIVVALLSLLSNRKLILDKYKKEIKDSLNSSIETYNARIQLGENTSYIRLTEEELSEYDFKSQVSGCLSNGEKDPEIYTLCAFNETDITNLLNYKIYDSKENEIIKFDFENLQSSDNFKTSIAYYNYYEKDSDGNYLLDETKKNLKISKKYLEANEENVFHIRYYIVDNHNILAKEATRDLIIDKYNNYINIVNGYFKVAKAEILNYDYKANANSYKYNGSSLLKDNSILNYDIYNSSDELITFYIDNGTLYYKNVQNEIVDLTNSEEKFRVRFYTGTIDSPTSETKYAYFSIE